MYAKSVMHSGSKYYVRLFCPPVRIWAMKFGEHIGLGQRNCQLDFGGDPGLEFMLLLFFIFNHRTARDRDLI